MLYCINFLSTLIINFTIILFLDSKYLFRFDKKYRKYVVFLYTLIIAFVNIFHIPLLNLISNFIVFYLIDYICFEKRKLRLLLFDGYIIFICMMIDNFVHLFVEWIIIVFDFHFSFEQVYIIKTSFIAFVFIIVCMLIYKHYLEDMSYISYRDTLVHMFFPISTIILTFLAGNTLNYELNENAVTQLFVVALILMIMNFFMLENYFSLNERYKMEIMYSQEMNKSQMDERYYRDLKEKYEETRRMIHDFKKHLTVIAMMNEAHHDVQEYIEETTKHIDKTHVPFYSQNKILDIILNDKISYAKQKGIEIDAKISVELMGETFDFISEFDMVSLFANLLDNAIEAVENIDDKRIELKIYNVKEMLHIEERNACHNQLKKKRNYYISTKKKHSGLGVSIMERMVDKYQGMFSIDIQDGVCNVFITIPIPHDFKQ